MGFVEQKLGNFRLQRIFGLVIVLFVIVLSVISLDLIRNRVKDSRRKADIKQIQTALELYRANHGVFPVVADNDFGGWDTSYEPLGKPQEFLNILQEEKLIDHVPFDPVYSNYYFYRYKKFPAGSFGCKDAFYILQIMNFEAPTDNHGWGECSQRNFVNEAPNGYTVQVFE